MSLFRPILNCGNLHLAGHICTIEISHYNLPFSQEPLGPNLVQSIHE